MGLELALEPFGRYRDEIRFFLASAADRITCIHQCLSLTWIAEI